MSKERSVSDSIPSSKVQRAARFAKTGVKVGRNYVKHYAKKITDKNVTQEDLDRANAEDIYDTLSELKGSALKVAQMLSMSENTLPSEYTEKFKMSQYSVPPLSYPLVVKTFRKEFGKSPNELFKTFTKEAVNAASIGQVHQATTEDGRTLAVKVQYPGVAESVRSDLQMVKPFARRLMRLNESELNLYMKEVENMLVDETDYNLELERSIKITEAAAHLPHLRFPKYYAEYSSSRILTMEWVKGKHLDKFMKDNPPQEACDQIGQALWDFYDFQMHTLKEVHADPHPGNFLLTDDGTAGVIDFGCVKVIPEDYYEKHFQVIERSLLSDEERKREVFRNLRFILPEDTPEQEAFFSGIFTEMLDLITRPFEVDVFDFGDKDYFNELNAFGEKMSQLEEFRNSPKARGSRHAMYLNRAYFGMFFMLHELGANVKTHSAWFE
ncbi:MAG: AarF/ABC1/UbiB kinase family protein [Bacteroidota bacterium]